MNYDQKGFTIVELLVAILIIGITTASISSLFISVQGVQRKSSYLDSATRAAQRQVESLRNEIIHNGSLDFHDTLYYGIKEDVIEYWIYATEFDKSGRLSSYNGRKKFYSNEKNTFNKLLPELMLDVIKYLQNTFELLISIFDTKITTNENEFINYNHEISRWYSLH